MSRLLRSSRQFATAAAASHGSHAKRPEVNVGKLSNGLKIASHETFGPVSTVSFVVNGSSRFENSENLGVSHFLRLFGFKGVQGRTHLRLVREIDNHGGNLTIASDREKIVYTAHFLRNDLHLVFDLLSGVFTSPEYVLHELNEVRNRVTLDLDQLSQNYDEQVIELLHKTAFRNGLGNSNYAPRVNLGAIHEKTLHDYTKKHFVSGNIALIATGVNFHDLESVAASHLGEIGEGKVSPSSSKYYGGEVHLPRLCPGNSRVAVAFPTAGHQEKDKMTATVLQKILGGSAGIPYSKGNALYAKIADKASIDSFNFKYSDAGLFGFYVKAPHNQGISKVVEGGLAQIHNLANSVSEADFTRGKNQAKLYLLSLYEKSSHIKLHAHGLLENGQVPGVEGVAQSIDQVTASDVQKFAAKLVKATPTIVVAADDY
jgi:ubiquinol-cytochrome c reductase core subunit 2